MPDEGKKQFGRRALLQAGALMGAGLNQVINAESLPRDSVPDELILNYHLMHPGGESAPGDPNAAFYLDGRYHLHYILRHPYRGKTSFSFVHVSSPDMLRWTWHKTSLQPSFTGHGMFSGTGFITREGRPATIYHGEGSGRNQIAIAKDNRLEDWEKPYPIEPVMANGQPAQIQHWDPDCFRVGDTYYAYSGGLTPALMKSSDLKQWTYIGDLLQHNHPSVLVGEDVSCGNFFPLGNKWMLLCISHTFGCRYYLGDWDAAAQQFVPTVHGRMSWRREDQPLDKPQYLSFFAPESVLAPDGRRVMWAWLANLHPQLNSRTVQSLPRELSVAPDGTLRIRPLRELEALRHDQATVTDVELNPPANQTNGGVAIRRIADLNGDSFEIRVVVERSQAERKRFGVVLFGGDQFEGLPVLIRPETRTIRAGVTEAPFAVADLPAGEDVELRVFVDKYLVEVFVNGRQALVAAQTDYRGKTAMNAYAFGGPTKIKSVDIWRLRPTNQGLLEARANRIWAPATV